MTVPSPAARFRRRLMLSMMIVVATLTVVTLVVVRRSTQAGDRQQLRDEFRGSLGFLLGAQEARQRFVMERCRTLAKSVRIRAALEEDDVRDLYQNAEIELRDILRSPSGGGASLQAEFCRFLNATGQVLVAETAAGPAAPRVWERQLERSGLAADQQRAGYLSLELEDGRPTLLQIIATPVMTPEEDARLGTLVLGFRPIDPAPRPGGAALMGGIWHDGRLDLPALDREAVRALQPALADAVHAPDGDDLFVTVRGEPYLAFHQRLAQSPELTPAWQVCLYPLRESLERQRRIQWRILGAGGAVMLLGWLASLLVSGRFAQPVAQLAADSARQSARRQQAEAALEVTEQKYRGIVENALEGIFVLSPEGRYLDANPALARLLGFDSPAGLLAEPTDPARQWHASPEQAARLLREASAAGVVRDFECELVRRDGTRVWVSQNLRAQRDDAGRVVHFEGTLEDITARRRAADELRAANTQLEKALSDLSHAQQQMVQQERLRALGQMASGIAHDFNNAIMPIVGFSELLLLQPDLLRDAEKAAHYLNTIHTGARDAASIVGRLREFYRPSDAQDVHTAVDAARIVEQVVALTRPKWKDQAQAAGARIEVVTNLADTEPVSGEESALRELLTNLVFNAVDAMPTGGTLTLSTWQERDQVVLSVADTGTGMTPAVRERCLEPFFSTKGDRGTGLGLAMVFGIVQRHGGAIDIETEPGRGTTFLVRLPVHRAGAAAPGAPAPGPAPRPLRVLVVDDEPQIRDVLTALLVVDGHQVGTAATGVGALDLVRAGGWDVVITDKAMPDLTGDEVAAAVKDADARVGVVLITGFGSFLPDEPVPHVDRVLSKPVTLPELRRALQAATRTA